ncbi:cell division protein ZapE [Agromyces sp. H66]|uniref:cell division protein ZapE n=1 Tax=Agromyces sp. H66 TaxID=2529859 RepID=UPI0010AA59BB|nr:cell division protein ZapE [Agromyces sp. H66]
MRAERELVAAIEAAAARARMVLDPEQRLLVARMAVLGAAVDDRRIRRSRPRGLYVHGPAGRGKSWLADAFFAALPTARKTRVHFHGFFAELHDSIHERRSERQAVERAIDDLTGRSRLLFFDELHVHDSGDARLLTRLLDHVFRRDIVVLATSNYAPDDLLPSPIWHHTIEPGIALITANMDTYRLDGPTDYRTVRHEHSSGFSSGMWITSPPSDAPGEDEATILSVRGRDFQVLAARSDGLWITFAQLCQSPTSTIEYLEWARSYPRWTVTRVPAFEDVDAEAQQRFINLVDVLVDADVGVTFVSDHDLATFLSGASSRPDAFRMASRLQLLRDDVLGRA